jgi:colanic acid/amylovoran biosynthesis glycosyltransferase
LLVPERDPDTLADALSKLLENPDRWPAMGQAGREHVETTHSIPAIISTLVDLYRSVQ